MGPLIALYNSTNGPDWYNNDNWLSDKPLYEWFGVRVDINGRVTELNLITSSLKGSLPPELGELDQLKHLWIGPSQLSGVIPREFGRLTQLRSLSLEGNDLTGPIPHEIGMLPRLQNLRLARNRLSGEIPPSIMSSETLSYISLEDNELTGLIPSEFAENSRIGSLRIYGNQLNSEIPAEIGQLQSLYELWLHDNQLTGMIPSSIGKLQFLKEFSAYNNQLIGQIPDGLSRLPRLEWLRLDNNQLTGTISERFGHLEQLRGLYIGGNNFSGCVPNNLRDLEYNDVYFANIPMCGEPERAEAVVPPFVKLAISDAATPVQILAIELGAQWINDFATELGWPASKNTITVYVDDMDGLARSYAHHVDNCELPCASSIINHSKSAAVAGAVFVSLNTSVNAAAEHASRTAQLIFHALRIEVMGERTSSERNRDPRWLADGLATLFAELALADGTGQPRNVRRRYISDRISSWLEPLWNMEDGPLTGWQPRGAAAIDLLATQVGLKTLIKFCTERTYYEDWRITFERVFGISVPDFYELYNQHHREGYPLRELPNLGNTQWP